MDKIEKLVNDFQESIKNPDTSVGIAIIRILTAAIIESSSTTVMGVDQEISQLLDAIQKACPAIPAHFRGAAQVFRAGMSKASEAKNANWKSLFVDHANQCLADAERILNLMPEVCQPFLQHGMTILTRGFDPMVASVLKHVAKHCGELHVIITEGRPHNDGVKLAEKLKDTRLKVTVIPDSAVGLWMNKAQAVLVGTDLVLGDGGLLAPVGTYNLCALASISRRPVYCVCETFKFMRRYVLAQSDLVQYQRNVDYEPTGLQDGETVDVEASAFDVTPAKFITLLLTEKGPMPPTAVAHELSKLLGLS